MTHIGVGGFGGSVAQRAPKKFLLFLAFGLVVSLSLSIYLEQRKLLWLQEHPISVNLISGVIGFCGGFLAIALIYNRLLDAEWIKTRTASTLDRWNAIIQELRDAHRDYSSHSGTITFAATTWARPSPAEAAERWRAKQRDAVRRFQVAGMSVWDDLAQYLVTYVPENVETSEAAAKLWAALERIATDEPDSDAAMHDAWKELNRLSDMLAVAVPQHFRLRRAAEM